jgi:eukaryotic-like serine/threonine-protein kinase
MSDPTMTRPNLTTEQWRRVFARVDQTSVADHAANANAAGDADPDVAVALKFFESSKDRIAPESFSFSRLADEIAGATSVASGQRCGNYELIEPIGRGGMGSVWRARRSDGLYNAEVAVKLLGTLALSSHARARFAREGQLLSRLTHPNIARLLDAGVTDDGQRFLVLELIEGDDIAAYCAAQSTCKKLEVFRQLLSAVSYAHAQLVLHRDIKPSNVLVDKLGSLKLLDFGVAKLLDDAEDELTRHVGTAATERYAAPEQLRGDAVGTATDVFALGSLLVELLSGEKINWSRPKREWSVFGGSVVLTTSLENVGEDLHAICRKAISMAPEERYASVTEFDDDLLRYLGGEPVRARAPSAWDRFVKFVRRHRGYVATGSFAALAVIASLVFAVIQLIEAREQERLAQTEAAKANEIAKFTTGLFSVLDPKVASAVDRSKLTAKEILDAGRERIKTELHDQPDVRLAMLGTLAEMYGRLEFEAEFESLNNERIASARERYGEHHPVVYESVTTEYWSDIYRGNYAKAKSTIESLEAGASARGERGERGDERRAIRLHGLAEIQSLSGAERGEPLLNRYRATLAAFEAAQSASPEHAAAIANYGNIYMRDGDTRSALTHYNRAIAMMENARKNKSYVINEGDVFLMFRGRGRALQGLGQYDEAEQAFRRAIDLATRSAGESHVLTKQLRGDLAYLLHIIHRRDEAWKLMNTILATETPHTNNTVALDGVRVQRARMLFAEAKHGEARGEVLRAIENWRKTQKSPLRLREAETLLAEIEATCASACGAQSPNR